MSHDLPTTSARRSFYTRLFAGVLISVAVIVAVVVVWQVLRWQSEAQEVVSILRIKRDRSMPGISSPHVESRDEYEIRKRETAALIKSPFILGKVLDDREINRTPLVQNQSHPLAFLGKRLYVQHQPDSELITIGMKGRLQDTDDMVCIVNAVVETYFEYDQQEQDRKFLALLTVLDKELFSAKELVKNLNEELNEARQRMGDEIDVPVEFEFKVLELENARELAALLSKASLEAKVNNKRPSTIERLDPETGAQALTTTEVD